MSNNWLEDLQKQMHLVHEKELQKRQEYFKHIDDITDNTELLRIICKHLYDIRNK